MRIRPLDIDFQNKIIKNKEFLDALIQEGLSTSLIRKAVHHKTCPPYECHGIFFEKPLIEEIKEQNSEHYKNITYALRSLSALCNNPILEEGEKKILHKIEGRIRDAYEYDLTDRKAIMDSFTSDVNIEAIEDYADYPEDSFGWEIDPDYRTMQQCEGMLIQMLYEYIKKFSDAINDKMPIGHESDYTQKDILELIAEILNLRWSDAYDYDEIRNIFRNFRATKI